MMRFSIARVFVAAALSALLVSGLSVSTAAAEQPWWHAQSQAFPGVLSPGHQAQIVMVASNLGDAAVSARTSQVTMTDVLPAHVKATGIASSNAGYGLYHGEVVCATSFPAGSVTCTWSGAVPLQPYEQLEVTIDVEVEAGAPLGLEPNEVRVSGGEGYLCRKTPTAGRGSFRFPYCNPGKELAESGDFVAEPSGQVVAGVSSVKLLTIGSGPTPFGADEYELAAEGEDGKPVTQAGSHPFQLTTTVALNQGDEPGKPIAIAKDLRFDWPAGLIGNPVPLPQCNEREFSAILGEAANLCPEDTAVGVAAVYVALSGNAPGVFDVPVFNLVPAPGEPARFGFEVSRVPVMIDTAVRSGRDYGIVVSTRNLSQVDGLVYSRVTVWGTPGVAVHDRARGWSCLAGGFAKAELPPCAALGASQPPPFLTLPTSCTGPLPSSVQGDSWPAGSAGRQQFFAPLQTTMTSLDGCNSLPFEASISAAPDLQSASSPTGLSVKVHVPQEASLNPNGLAGADVKDTTVTLPEGMVLNPAGADGLVACSESQVGFESVDGASATNLFTPDEAACPDAAKIATVKITLPVIPNPLVGSVFLAAQNANPFGSLVAMYLVAKDPVSGVLIKLAGEVSLSQTGQIVTTFKNTPQAPFEDLELHFFGGDRAPLATPAHCGTYTTEASFTPWSGNAPVKASSSFQVTSGVNGTPCPNPLLFAPSLTAGTTSIQAGGFSPFSMTMSRDDGQQNLQSISLHMPPGLSGLLSSVKLCGDAQANAGTCGSDSEIGETIVSVGLGGDPFSVKGGKVFVTEGYEGAPYGLSIVNPAKAGPFDLGQVVVRARIEVNPITAALTITTDNAGPYKIPTILDGIPLQIKHVNVTINRPAFTFNPTNCNPMSITGRLSSTEGATSNVSVPLQVTNCAVLGFKPGFSVSTNGRTSRQSGASLHVKLTYPKAPFGSQANISKVKVDLPRQLPSRLSTLQKACPDSTFNQNPANCDAESRIGTANATTPLLPVPLAGPVYFVSHAGLKFPELVIVLSGYGTTVQLHAETFISKAGVTSSTFRTIPDVPVGRFELTLPQGKYSALAAPGDLCGTKLKMPTAFTAQNGALIKQSTPITVSGCVKHRAKKKTKHGKK